MTTDDKAQQQSTHYSLHAPLTLHAPSEELAERGAEGATEGAVAKTIMLMTVPNIKINLNTPLSLYPAHDTVFGDPNAASLTQDTHDEKASRGKAAKFSINVTLPSTARP